MLRLKQETGAVLCVTQEIIQFSDLNFWNQSGSGNIFWHCDRKSGETTLGFCVTFEMKRSLRYALRFTHTQGYSNCTDKSALICLGPSITP
jgi:hypothetical protein